MDFTSQSLGTSMLYSGGAGARWDSNHYLQQVAAGTPRYHYPLPDSVCRGILLEGPYTNYLDNSGALNASPWSPNKCSLAKNQTGADNLANAAYTLTGTAYTSGTVHKSYVSQTLAADETGASVADMCLYAVVKKGTERYACLRARTEGQNIPEVVCDLNYQLAHSVATGGGVLKDYNIIYLGNLWYLLWMTFDGRQTSGTTTIQGQVGIAPPPATVDGVLQDPSTLDWGTAGSANKTLIIHSLDLIRSSYPVMPIFNSAAPVARGGDLLWAPNTTGVNAIANNNRDIYLELFIPRKPYGTDWRYLYSNGSESLQMSDTGLRWYIDSTNYLAATIHWQEHGVYMLGLEKRSSGTTKLWCNGATVASSSAAAFLASVSSGANWYLGSDGASNYADVVYSAIEYSAV